MSNKLLQVVLLVDMYVCMYTQAILYLDFRGGATSFLLISYACGKIVY